MRNIRILKSKLIRPKTENTFKRTRLLPFIEKSKHSRLTTIIAGAGFGKTTLVSRTTKVFGTDTVWFSLSRGDSDLIIFIRYLVAGINKYYPNFGEETLNRLTSIKSLKHEREEILNIFLSEFEMQITDHIIIVLEDYHLVNHNDDINKAVEYLILHLAKRAYLCIISRKETNIKLSKLRVAGDILEITENELTFSSTEIEQLFEETFEMPISEENILKLKSKTNGWVTGLIIFYHYCRKKPKNEIGQLLSDFSGANKDIACYMNENVYDDLPESIQNFLFKTSILSKFSVDLMQLLFTKKLSRYFLKQTMEKG